MSSLSRRVFLGSGVTGGILTAAAAAAVEGGFGNPDQPAEGAVNVTNPKALTEPGASGLKPRRQRASFLDPPATDVNGMPQFWASSNLAPKRIRTAAGRGRSPRMTSRFRRPSRESTCGWAEAVFVSFIGTSKRNGPS